SWRRPQRRSVPCVSTTVESEKTPANIRLDPTGETPAGRPERSARRKIVWPDRPAGPVWEGDPDGGRSPPIRQNEYQFCYSSSMLLGRWHMVDDGRDFLKGEYECGQKTYEVQFNHFMGVFNFWVAVITLPSAAGLIRLMATRGTIDPNAATI